MIGVAVFSKSYKTPMADEYHAKMNVTELCTSLEASKHRPLIGCDNWIVALGRFNIAYATSTLSRYSTLPRKGHYKAAQRIFGYLKKFPHGKLLIDANQPLVRDKVKIDMDQILTEFD